MEIVKKFDVRVFRNALLDEVWRMYPPFILYMIALRIEMFCLPSIRTASFLQTIDGFMAIGTIFVFFHPKVRDLLSAVASQLWEGFLSLLPIARFVCAAAFFPVVLIFTHLHSMPENFILISVYAVCALFFRVGENVSALLAIFYFMATIIELFLNDTVSADTRYAYSFFIIAIVSHAAASYRSYRNRFLKNTHTTSDCG